MVVHDLVHIEEMRHLEIKFQQFFFVRKGIMLIQEIVDRSIETVQRRHKSIDPLLPAITLTLPFHGEQIPVAPVKIPCDLRVRLLHQPLCAQEIVLEQRGAVHIPAAVEQIVRLVDQEYIVLLSDTVRKKTLEIYPRIEHIIIVADHGITEQTHVQAELERADLIARRVLLYFFPRKMILVRQQVIQGVIDPVKMTVRIGTCVRIALRFGPPVIQRIFRLKSLLPQKTDLVLRRQRDRLHPKPFFLQKAEALLRHSARDGLGGEVKYLLCQPLPHGLHCRKNCRYRLADTCRCLEKEFSLVVDSLIDICDKLLLPLAVRKWKLQLFDRIRADPVPPKLKVRPFPVLLHQFVKPLLQLRKGVVLMKIFELLRLNMAVCHTHADMFYVIFPGIHIRVTFCLRKMDTHWPRDPFQIPVGTLDLIDDHLFFLQ